MKFAVSFSGGKDSFLSLKKMIDEGHTLVSLVVSTNIDGHSWTHNLELNYFKEIASKLNCGVIFTNTDIENYEKNFEKSLSFLKKIGIEACVFGDIDNEQHLNWNRERCKNVGIECIMPLAYSNRRDVVFEFLNMGVRAVVVKVDENKLDKSYLGRVLDEKFILEIEGMEGIDICGENGEYHTRIVL